METAVASLIFLLLFTLSLQTLTQMRVRRVDSKVYEDISAQHKNILREALKGEYSQGIHNIKSEAGSAQVTLQEYNRNPSLIEITIDIEYKRVRIIRRHIVKSITTYRL